MGKFVGGFFDSVGDVLGGAADVVGDIVGGAGDVIGDIGGSVFDIVDEVGNVVGDFAGEIDWDDAIITYITSGGDPFATAFAATDFDEEIGVNPFSYYNPETGGFSFMPGESGGIPVPQDAGIDWGAIAGTALDYLINNPSSGGGGTPSPSIAGYTPATSYEEIITNILNSLQGSNIPGLDFGNIFNPSQAGLISLLTTGQLGFGAGDIGEFVEKYPGLIASIYAGLSYADQKRINEQLQQGFEQYGQRKSDFAQKIASGETRKMPVARPTAMGGGLMSLRNNYMKGSSMPMGKPRKNQAGIMELDYREKGGFVPPIGIKEKADDIPAMLSNNEFVFTAEAVKNAGKGNAKKGAEKMYALMKKLENGGMV